MSTSARLRSGELVRIRDERWRVLSVSAYSAHTAVEVRGCERSNAGTTAVFLSPAEPIELLAGHRATRLVRRSAWRRTVRRDLADALPRFDSLRAAARADVTLLPFQLEPVLAVTAGLGCRLLLADDVGLGKTIQAGLIVAEMLHRVTDARVLVLTPAALREQWRTELESRFHVPVTALDAHGVARSAAAIPAGTNPWSVAPVIVASIDYAKRPEVLRALEPLVWDALVLDEAHSLCGASDRAATAATLAARARIVVGLSATPHSGDADAFQRLCNLGRLPDDTSLLVFRRTRSDIGLASTRRMKWLRVRLSDAEVDLERALLRYARLVWRQHTMANPARLAMIVLVKRACSSATALVRSLQRRLSLLAEVHDESAAPGDRDNQLALPFEPTGSDAEPDRVLAAPGLTDARAERLMLEDLLAMARVATQSERKLAFLRRLLRRCHEPVLVFTEYRDTLEHVAARLHGLDAAIVHGALTSRERREALARFTHGDARVLLATDAASEGLNLHYRCRMVIHVELPWSPLRLEQRTGRVDRMGQRRIVHALHLVARGTAEEGTVQMLLARRAQADAALNAARDAGRLEEEIIASVMATPLSRDDDAPAVPPPMPQTVRHLDLRQQAIEEAARLSLSRVLAAGRPTFRDDGRAVLSRLRQSGRGRCLWAFRVQLADESGHATFTTLIGFEAAIVDACQSSDLVRWLATGAAAARARDAARRQLTESLALARRVASLWLARQQAIRGDIQTTRARMAPRQPGLFGHGPMREYAAQMAILDEALARCDDRLDRLVRAHQLSLGECDLAFAAFL